MIQKKEEEENNTGYMVLQFNIWRICVIFSLSSHLKILSAIRERERYGQYTSQQKDEEDTHT